MQNQDMPKRNMQTPRFQPPQPVGGVAGPGEPKLLEQVRHRMRALHVAKRTEEAYVSCIYRFLRYHKDKYGDWVHPTQLGNDDVNEFARGPKRLRVRHLEMAAWAAARSSRGT